jgi:hypothetical protein
MQFSATSLRSVLACTFVLVFLATGWGIIEAQSLDAVRQERDALKLELNSKAVARTDANRRECAQDAQAAFEKAGYSESASSPQFAAEAFTDHYSRKYDRCLIELLLTGKRGEATRMIYDANEHQDFGEYYWFPSATKKFWEQKPIQCTIIRPGQDQTFCSSTAEWEAYEREMMNS